MKRIIAILFAIICVSVVSPAQILTPVKWKTHMEMIDGASGVVTLTATIDPGYHMYGTNVPAGGPEPTSVTWNNQGVQLVGHLTPSKPATEAFDETFGMDLSWWTGKVTLKQKFVATNTDFHISGSVRYMACNDKNFCTQPTNEAFAFNGKAPGAVSQKMNGSGNTVILQAETPQQPEVVAATPAADSVAATPVVSPAELWTPVDTSLAQEESQPLVPNTGDLWYVIITCFLGGFLALLTPCVWPMIPMTVSFFLKKSDSRRRAVGSAVTYGISIVVIFLLLGIIFTAIFGASALNALATNAVCNIVFFLILVVFAISFFGAFELALPESWSNKMDATANKTTGLLSIFFMAATLVLVSFSCTGPIIGTLLVEAASHGNMMAPLAGMAAFSLALAIPFTLFALFPSVLKKLPRSGGWMGTVKVVLGFIELALALKFLSVADLAYGWHILDRETFLALWIVIFGLLGLYLLGVFRFKTDEPTEGIGVLRFFFATISLAFTIYLIPGLWGAPLKATSAFVSPLYTQDFNLYGGEQEAYNDYDAGMKAAAEQGKPVFLEFSGYGCVNCRKMEGAVLDAPKVKQLLSEKFVTITLMVDDKTDLPQPMVVEENNKTITLKTVGDKWSYLQRHKFNSNSQPYYVVLDAEGHLLSGPRAYDENVAAFTAFLQKALQ